MLMNQDEKCEMLKKSIEQLYSKEGRSRIYISNLLGLNRKILGLKIKEWGLEDPEPLKHLNPSTIKFINKNKQLIKARLDNDISISNIAKELGCDRSFLSKVLQKDEILNKAREDYLNRVHTKVNSKKEELKNNSKDNYIFNDLENERWVEILGFNGYFVSNMGRVKHYIKSYDSYILLTPYKNTKNGRLYISLSNNGIKKNFNLARLVGHAFCPGFSNENNTINYKDGNIDNNYAENLEWVSQNLNNKHAYDVLNKRKNVGKPLNYYILYKDKYRFKTITAFAKFLGKSETQIRRYLEKPEEYNIKLIQKK